MRNEQRMTPCEIAAQIETLEAMLAETETRVAPSARCARAYLRQMLVDRRTTLRALETARPSDRRATTRGAQATRATRAVQAA